MSRAAKTLIATAMITSAVAVPQAHADGKPADVHDATLTQIAPSDAAERILRTSQHPFRGTKPTRSGRKAPRHAKGRRASR